MSRLSMPSLLTLWRSHRCIDFLFSGFDPVKIIKLRLRIANNGEWGILLADILEQIGRRRLKNRQHI